MNMNDDRTSSHAKQRPAGQLGGLLAKGGKLEQEDDEGAVEYKWRLTCIAPSRFEHLVTQMKFRVAEGRGQCVYELGVDDDGHPRGLTDSDFEESLDTLRRMADRLGYYLTVIHERKVPSNEPGAKPGDELTCAELHVSKSNANETQDLRIAMCGAVDAGKSTLVSVLANGTLDDGRGSVRQFVFNHKHELNTGRTSSVSEKVVGFDSEGKITNYDEEEDNSQSAFNCASNFYGTSTAHCMTETIAERSVKLVTLMDLAGSEKYSKTTLSGITTKSPGYACIVASLTQPKEHLIRQVEMCTSLRTRFFIVLNKADRVGSQKAQEFLAAIAEPLGHLGFETKVVASHDDAKKCALGLKANLIQHPAAITRTPSPCPTGAGLPGSNSQSKLSDEVSAGEGSQHSSPEASLHTAEGENPTAISTAKRRKSPPPAFGVSPTSAAENPLENQTVPLFFASCVRGDGCEFLKRFLHHLPPAVDDPQSLNELPPEILVDQCFKIPGVGHVFAGFVKQGVVEIGSKLSIGPDRRGNFTAVTVASIHIAGSNVRKVTPGLEATFVFSEPLPRALDVNRKGINIISRQNASTTVCMEFEAEVTVQQLIGGGSSNSLRDLSNSNATEEKKKGTVEKNAVLPGQEPVCYCRNIRQAVKILSIDRGSLAKGQFGIVKCRFLYHPEVLDVDGVVVLASANARMIGTTTTCCPISPATANAPSPQMFPCEEFGEDQAPPLCGNECLGAPAATAGDADIREPFEREGTEPFGDGKPNGQLAEDTMREEGQGENLFGEESSFKEKKHRKYRDTKKKPNREAAGNKMQKTKGKAAQEEGWDCLFGD